VNDERAQIAALGAVEAIGDTAELRQSVASLRAKLAAAERKNQELRAAARYFASLVTDPDGGHADRLWAKMCQEAQQVVEGALKDAKVERVVRPEARDEEQTETHRTEEDACVSMQAKFKAWGATIPEEERPCYRFVIADNAKEPGGTAVVLRDGVPAIVMATYMHDGEWRLTWLKRGTR